MMMMRMVKLAWGVSDDDCVLHAPAYLQEEHDCAPADARSVHTQLTPLGQSKD